MFKKVFKMFGDKNIKVQPKDNKMDDIAFLIKDRMSLIENRLDSIESALTMMLNDKKESDSKPKNPFLRLSLRDLSEEAKEKLLKEAEKQLKIDKCLEESINLSNEEQDDKKTIIETMIIAGVNWSEDLLEAPLYITEEEYWKIKDKYEEKQRLALELLDKKFQERSSKEYKPFCEENVNLGNVINKTCNYIRPLLEDSELYKDIDYSDVVKNVYTNSLGETVNMTQSLYDTIKKGMDKIKEILPKDVVIRYNNILCDEEGVQYDIQFGTIIENKIREEIGYKIRVFIDGKKLKNFFKNDEKTLDKIA